MRRHETIPRSPAEDPPSGGGWGAPPGDDPGWAGPPPYVPPPRDEVAIGEVVESLLLLVRRAGVGLWGTLGGLLGVGALVQLPSWLVGLLATLDPSAMAASALVTTCLGIVTTLAVVALFLFVLFGLYRPARRLLLDGPADPPADVSDTVREALADRVSVVVAVLLFLIPVAVGLVLFILPGIVAAFFLTFAPYLVVTQGMDAGEALTRSVELSMKYAAPMLLVVVVAFGGLAVVFVGSLVVGAIVGAALGPHAAGAFMAPISYVAYALAVFLGWGASAATLVTIDAAESGDRIADDGVAAA